MINLKKAFPPQWILRLASCGLAAVSASAQVVPKLNALSAEWLQRGTKAELSLYGEHLAAATNIIVSGAPGLSANFKLPPAASAGVESSLGGIRSVAQPDQTRLQIQMESADNAALTAREIRVVSPGGVSNPLPIHLSPLPELASNNALAREKPQDIVLPVIVSGSIQAPAESDFFRFNGNKGDHVVIDVNAYRMESPLDSSLSILNAAGKELARSEDAAGLDSVLDFQVPETAAYTIELRDFRYQGGGDYKYRMTVGVLPHVFSAFPYGAQRGQTVDLTLHGVNLDSDALHLAIAADAPVGRQELRAAKGSWLSNPFAFEITDLPAFNEAEPNTALDQADAITLPIAINGHIGKEKDYDAFKFNASKGQRVIFEVNAYRHGSPLDAVLTVTDSVGNVLQRNDDASGSDARIDFTFPSDGEFFVLIEDLLGRGGDEFGYRLTAAIPRPNFALTITRDTPRVHRGGRVPIRCELSRANGFDKAVKVSCEDLPPGVYAEPLLLEGATSTGLLILEAGEGAVLGTFPLKVVAASVGSDNMRRNAQPLSNDKPVTEAFLTVLEPAPFSVIPTTLLATVEQNQSENVDVIVERRNGFDGEIRINPEGFSAGREPVSRSFDFAPLVLKAGETRGSISLRAKTDSEIGTRELILRAEADHAGGPITEYSTALPVRTIQIPFVLSTSLRKLVVTALPPGTSSSAGEAVFKVKCDRRGGFSGPIEIKLAGIPEGIVATVTNIAENANEATVKLVATEKAPPIKDVQVTLSGSGLQKDRTYRIDAAPISLTIDAPSGSDMKESKLANSK